MFWFYYGQINPLDEKPLVILADTKYNNLFVITSTVFFVDTLKY